MKARSFNIKENRFSRYPLSLFKNLVFYPPQPVLTKSSSLSDWDSFGVRDPAILSDEQGNFVEESGQLVMFYTGSSDGKRQYAGRAVSKDRGLTWARDPAHPVLQSTPGAWDCGLATTPWVIKCSDGLYRMYYRGAVAPGVEEGIGLAISTDGIHFKKDPQNPLLTPKDFKGMRLSPSLMGVINIVRAHEGDSILLFEAYEKDYLQRGQIFAARSRDGITFTPMNKGYPLFSARHVTSWPVKGVCNPRLLPLEKGWYMLGFNGEYNGEYGIGVAFTKDFEVWQEHPANPVLAPRGWPQNDPFSYRLEGPVFDRQALLSGQEEVQCYFMSIPRRGKSHQNAVNALSVARRTLPTEKPASLISLPANQTSLGVTDKKISLNALAEPHGYIQSHYVFQNPVQKISFRIKALNGRKGALYVSLSNDLIGLQRRPAIIFKFTSRGIFVLKSASSIPGLYGKVTRRISSVLQVYFKRPVADWSFKKLRGLPPSDEMMVTLDYRESSQSVVLTALNRSYVIPFKESQPSRILSWGVWRAHWEVQDLKAE